MGTISNIKILKYSDKYVETIYIIIILKLGWTRLIMSKKYNIIRKIL